MRILLDTHTLLWALICPERLSEHVRKCLTHPENQRLISSATAWEIFTKYRLGKLPQARAVVVSYEEHLKILRSDELPIFARHAILAGSFPAAHKDPFDRILAAQSVLERVPLATNDPAFAQLPVEVFW